MSGNNLKISDRKIKFEETYAAIRFYQCRKWSCLIAKWMHTSIQDWPSAGRPGSLSHGSVMRRQYVPQVSCLHTMVTHLNPSVLSPHHWYMPSHNRKWPIHHKSLPLYNTRYLIVPLSLIPKLLAWPVKFKINCCFVLRIFMSLLATVLNWLEHLL